MLARSRKIEEERKKAAAEERKLYEIEKQEELIQKRIILHIGSKVINVFGTVITNDVAPIIKHKRTMLPVRLVAENLGAIVEWNPNSRTIIIIGKNIKTGDLVNVVLTIDSNKYIYNGNTYELDSPVFIQNRRTYIPVRLIAELLGSNVEWNGETQEIIISK